METLQSSVLAVCMLSIAVAVCMLICPNTVLQKQIRFLISLLFVISLALPLKQIEFPDSLEQMQRERSQQTVQEVTEHSVEDTLNTLLAQNAVLCQELNVTVHIDENYCISITDVSVICDDVQHAVEIMKEVLGEGVEIHAAEILE